MLQNQNDDKKARRRSAPKAGARPGNTAVPPKAAKPATTPAASPKATPAPMPNAVPAPIAATPRPLNEERVGLIISTEERRRLIAESAYFRSLRRGPGGDPGRDWIEAEAEIDAMLLNRR